MAQRVAFVVVVAGTVVADTYTRHEGVACDGRNEILVASGSGYTLEECQAVCSADPSCVSIEYGVADNAGACQASTSCTVEHWATSQSQGRWDVYTREVSIERMAASWAALAARVAQLEQQNRCLQWHIEPNTRVCVGSLSTSELTGIQIRA